jgi:hypothetical protein
MQQFTLASTRVARNCAITWRARQRAYELLLALLPDSLSSLPLSVSYSLDVSSSSYGAMMHQSWRSSTVVVVRLTNSERRVAHYFAFELGLFAKLFLLGFVFDIRKRNADIFILNKLQQTRSTRAV